MSTPPLSGGEEDRSGLSYGLGPADRPWDGLPLRTAAGATDEGDMDVITGLQALDEAVVRWAYGLDLPSLLAEGVSHLVTHGGVVVLAALALLVFGRGRTRRAGAALAAGLVAHVLVLEGLVKHAVERERPYAALGLYLRDSLVDPASYSFPSGHSAASFMAAAVVGARYPRARVPLFVLATLVALSRVHLGAHYPSDVVAGAVFGLVLGAILVRAFCVAGASVAGGEPEAVAGALERVDGGLAVEDELGGEATEQRRELEAVAGESRDHDDARLVR